MADILKTFKEDIAMNLAASQKELNELINTRRAHTSTDGFMVYDDKFDNELNSKINKVMKGIKILERMDKI